MPSWEGEQAVLVLRLLIENTDDRHKSYPHHSRMALPFGGLPSQYSGCSPEICSIWSPKKCFVTLFDSSSQCFKSQSNLADVKFNHSRKNRRAWSPSNHLCYWLAPAGIRVNNSNSSIFERMCIFERRVSVCSSIGPPALFSLLPSS